MRNVGVLLSCAVLSTLSGGCLQRELAEQNPCLTSGESESVGGTGIDQVDLLFVVDNSLSMLEEQVKLRAQFPKLIRTLTSGVRQDGRSFVPVTDLHLAVITTDMGTPGITTVSGCSESGDDGVLQHAGNPGGDAALQGCAASYPTFLQYRAQQQDSEQLARDFACIASVGSGGCGYEQQLEAPLKALWPRMISSASGAVSPSRVTFLDARGQASSTGHGDQANLGFLRSDAQRPSLLAIVLVTDEDDCSASTSEQFGRGAQYEGQHANLRCHHNPQNLWPITRYVDNYRALRPDRPDLVLFAAITGVPTRLIDAGGSVDFENDSARNAYYDSVLADPDMQETPIDTAKDPDTEPDALKPACEAQSGGAAAPARRIVELVKGMGAQATLQSICSESFEPAMDAVIDLISKRLGGVCLSKPVVRSSDGVVACNVVWELPRPEEGFSDAPRSCGERPFLAAISGAESPRGVPPKVKCELPQLPVRERNTVITAGLPEGWYYDDFSPEVLDTCSDRPTQQRISFTKNAVPPRGVTVSLQCLRQVQRYVDDRTDVDVARAHAEIGDSCEQPPAGATSRDQACWVSLLDPHGGAQGDGIDRGMFCHPERNVCVRACSGDDQCPPAWVCDQRENGSGFCVNPTCGEDTLNQWNLH